MSSDLILPHIDAVYRIIGLAAVVLAASLGIGHAVLSLLSRPRRCGTGAERWALGTVLGMAVWMVLTASCSHLGIGIAWPAFLGLLVGTVGIVHLLGSAGGLRRVPWLLVAAMLPALIWLLIPVALDGGYAPVNDHFTYISISEWLQGHPFSEPVPVDPLRPALTQPWQYQNYGFRMGGIFLLATVQCLSWGSTALQVLPVAGMVAVFLFLAGTWLLARLVCRLDQRWSGIVVLAGATGCHVLPFSLLSGFLPQVVGFAASAALLAWWSWILRRSRMSASDGVITGILLAWLASSYSEMLPVVGLAMTAGWLACIPRLRWAIMPGTVAALAVTVALGNKELLRAMAAIVHQLGTQVGRHIDLSAWEFLALGVGYPFDRVMLGHLPNLGDHILVVILLAGGLLGIVALMRRGRRPWTVVAAGVVLAALFGVFLCQPDPWTGDLGHSWSLYKVAQWACVISLPLQVLGFSILLRKIRPPWPLAMVAGLVIVLVAVGWSGHRELARRQRNGLLPFATLGDPVAELAMLPQAVAAAGADGLHLVRQEPVAFPWPDAVYGYAMIRHQLASNWHETTYFGGPSAITVPGGVAPTPAAALVAGGPVFGAGVRPWLAGLVHLPSDLPVMLRPIGPSQPEKITDGWVQWLGREAATWPIYRPESAPAHAVFRFQAEPGPDLSTGRPWILAWSLNDAAVERATYEGAASPVIPLRTEVGVNRLRVWVDSDLHKDAHRSDRRDLALLCRGWGFIGASTWTASAPLGLERAPTGCSWRWLGGETPIVMEVYALSAGRATIRFIAHAGPCGSGAERRLGLMTATESRELKVGDGAALRLEVDVPAGSSRISLRSMDRLEQPAPGGDPRPLLVGIEDLQCELRP